MPLVRSANNKLAIRANMPARVGRSGRALNSAGLRAMLAERGRPNLATEDVADILQSCLEYHRREE